MLLLDEPANGLDPAGITWLRGLLRGLAGEGRTIVVASHVLGEVAQTADRVVIVNAGRLRFAGPLRELGETAGALESAFLNAADGGWPAMIRSELPQRGETRAAHAKRVPQSPRPWLLLAAGPLIVVAGVTGLIQSGGNVHDPAVQRQALAHVGLAALFTLLFGLIAVAGEYRQRLDHRHVPQLPRPGPGHRGQAGRLRAGRRGRRAGVVGRGHRGHGRVVGGQGRPFQLYRGPAPG